jgi:non-heme chloroperoxidase
MKRPREEQGMTLAAKSVRLSTGVELEYAERGAPTGVPVVLLHGGFDSWHAFERLLSHLPSSIHAFALTLRGQGKSSKPADGYRPSELAEDVSAFGEALSLGPAVVVAHSSSSLVAQRFAIDHPERTLGLVLIGGFASMRDKPLAREVHQAALELTDPVDPTFVREFQESTVVQEVPEEFIQLVVRESNAPAHVWKALSAGVLEQDCAAELHRIQAPTLLVWGADDAASPRREQELLEASIQQSRLIVYHGAGHSVHWEEPERLAADLTAFATSLDESRLAARGRTVT